MKSICVFNGTTKLVLVPENDAERIALKELSSGEVTIQSSEKMMLLDKTLSDGIVIEKLKLND